MAGQEVLIKLGLDSAGTVRGLQGVGKEFDNIRSKAKGAGEASKDIYGKHRLAGSSLVYGRQVSIGQMMGGGVYGGFANTMMMTAGSYLGSRLATQGLDERRQKMTERLHNILDMKDKEKKKKLWEKIHPEAEKLKEEVLYQRAHPLKYWAKTPTAEAKIAGLQLGAVGGTIAMTGAIAAVFAGVSALGQSLKNIDLNTKALLDNNAELKKLSDDIRERRRLAGETSLLGKKDIIKEISARGGPGKNMMEKLGGMLEKPEEAVLGFLKNKHRYKNETDFINQYQNLMGLTGESDIQQGLREGYTLSQIKRRKLQEYGVTEKEAFSNIAGSGYEDTLNKIEMARKGVIHKKTMEEEEFVKRPTSLLSSSQQGTAEGEAYQIIQKSHKERVEASDREIQSMNVLSKALDGLCYVIYRGGTMGEIERTRQLLENPSEVNVPAYGPDFNRRIGKALIPGAGPALVAYDIWGK